MIAVHCPDCSKSYKVSPDLAGKKVRCKACDTSFTVTATTESARDHDESAVSPRQARSLRKSERPTATQPVEVSDDEFAGLNSVSSDGETIDELRELPSKRKRSPKRTGDDDAESRPRKKRKVSSESSAFSFGGPVTAIIAACVGGGAGAIIWSVIAILTQHEIGWIAWGIGLLVGVCVRFAAKEIDEFVAGVIAAIGSGISIVAGKALVALLIVMLLPAADFDAELINKTSTARFFLIFTSSFGVLDFVLFFLAVITAYRVGARTQEE